MMATPVCQRTRSRRRHSLQHDSPGVSISQDDGPLRIGAKMKSVSFTKESSPLAYSPTPSRIIIRNPSSKRLRSPLQPVENVVNNMRRRLEEQLQGVTVGGGLAARHTHDNISPGLAKLRSTPGSALLERQRELAMKHAEVRSRSDGLPIGGGVCMWPEMHAMRLTYSELRNLVIICSTLFPTTIVLFNLIHGSVWLSMKQYTAKLHTFPRPVYTGQDQASWDRSILDWHTAFTTLMTDLEGRFSVSLGRSTITYQTCVVLYLVGVTTLLYLLVDNIVSKNKLSPKRIKIWVCLLVVLGAWTVLAVFLLITALSLEVAIEETIREFSHLLSELVYTDLDLKTYHGVAWVWRRRCLPPEGRGTLSVLGLMRVRHVVHCLQYYSLPILTALLTPVLQLLLSLKDIYTPAASSS